MRTYVVIHEATEVRASAPHHAAAKFHRGEGLALHAKGGACAVVAASRIVAVQPGAPEHWVHPDQMTVEDVLNGA